MVTVFATTETYQAYQRDLHTCHVNEGTELRIPLACMPGCFTVEIVEYLFCSPYLYNALSALSPYRIGNQ